VTGFPAWIMHRGYHGLAIPTWERKARVFTNWLVHLFWGRDFSSISRMQRPREFFQEFAAKPALASKEKATATAR
jgi:NADH dehydrogenase